MHPQHIVCYIEIKNNNREGDIEDTNMTKKIFMLGLRSFTTNSTKNATNKGNVRYDDVK